MYCAPMLLNQIHLSKCFMQMVLIISHLQFHFTFINTININDKLINLQLLNAPPSSLHSAIAVPESSITENVRVAVLLLLLYLTLSVISLISQTVAVNNAQILEENFTLVTVAHPQRATVIPPCIYEPVQKQPSCKKRRGQECTSY